MKRKKGISLIVLVITIIIILILAGAIILNLVYNNPILKAKEAVFKNNIKDDESQLATWIANEIIKTSGNIDSTTIDATKDTGTYVKDGNTVKIEDIIPGIKEPDKIAIEDGKIKYIGTDDDEKTWATESGIETSGGSSGSSVVPIDIVTGWEHTMVLMSDGTVKVWGANYDGQLGINDTVDWEKYIPLDVPGLTNVKQLVSRGSFVLALLNDGTVKGWGYNWEGQLGLGTEDETYAPVTIPGLTNVKQLAAGEYHTLALLNDGTVKFMRME